MYTPSKAEVVLDLLISLNVGNSSYTYKERVDVAIKQYELLVQEGILFDPKESNRWECYDNEVLQSQIY